MHIGVKNNQNFVITYSIRLADIAYLNFCCGPMLKGQLSLPWCWPRDGFSLGLDHEGYGFGLGRKILALTTSLTESCVFVLFVLNNFNKQLLK